MAFQFSSLQKGQVPCLSMPEKEEENMNIRLFRKTLDRLMESLPPDLFQNLNGGVLVLPETREDGESLIMGEYIQDPIQGNTILLYYGSFAEELHGAPEEEWTEELEETLVHELRHHVEALAGVDYLSEEERGEVSS